MHPAADARPTALLSALPEEQAGLRERLERPVRHRHAGREVWSGRLHGLPVLLALSGIGKVAAAVTAATLAGMGARRIVFAGVAGGLAPGVRVGDLVVATGFVQHDMDASPLFPRHEVPGYGRSVFPADAELSATLSRACDAVCARAASLFDAQDMSRFGLAGARVHRGLLASGDRFVAAAGEAAALRAALPGALAVDMESAAVAQACADHGLPFAAVRTISDRADDTAHVDFPAFAAAVAGRYAQAVAADLCGLLSEE
ncbi:MAG: 5'-methylthioadenosine/adenosylhomocysteine nucleosidase [Xylophilus ampelinus]